MMLPSVSMWILTMGMHSEQISRYGAIGHEGNGSATFLNSTPADFSWRVCRAV